MISIIVCSISDSLFDIFSESVFKTIGTEFEIIRIENADNSNSICGAYNRGVSQAKFDVLCFVHEDVIFNTKDWGSTVVKIFLGSPNLGLLGIAGSRYKTFAPASWGVVPQARFVNIIQRYKYRDSPEVLDVQNPSGEPIAEVVCIDGVFMCTTKTIATEVGFDSKTLKGFHGYDIDFSLSIKQTYKVAVTFDILITHLSEGRNDTSWINDMMSLHKKWKAYLPATNIAIDSLETNKYEGYAVNDFLNMMMLFRYPASEIFKMLNYNNKNPNLHKNYLLSLKLRALKYWLFSSWVGRKINLTGSAN